MAACCCADPKLYLDSPYFKTQKAVGSGNCQLKAMTGALQMAEAALADEWVINGDRVALQRRVLRLGKPPRRWKRPSWASVAMREPLEVCALLFA